MKIVVGKKSGFCYGVKKAIDQVEEELKNSKEPLYCLGELVHNKTVIEHLKNQGVIFIENMQQAKGKTIIRAHGISKQVYEEAKNKKIALLDCTCPNVLKIHHMAEEYSKQGYYIFLIGHKDHPETIGTFTFCGKHAHIIATVEEVEEALSAFQKSNLHKLCVFSQTTYKLKLFEAIVEKIQKELPPNTQLEIKNTICFATEERQKETEEIAKQVDFMIVVGDPKSSNTTKLYDIACEHCNHTIFIENVQQLPMEKIDNRNVIGIVAGASTPPEIIHSIFTLLKEKKGE